MCALGPLASTTSAKTKAFWAASHRGPSSDSKATVLGMGAGTPAPGKASSPAGAAAPAGAGAGAVAQAGARATDRASPVARRAARATIGGPEAGEGQDIGDEEGEGMGGMKSRTRTGHQRDPARAGMGGAASSVAQIAVRCFRSSSAAVYVFAPMPGGPTSLSTNVRDLRRLGWDAHCEAALG